MFKVGDILRLVVFNESDPWEVKYLGAHGSLARVINTRLGNDIRVVMLTGPATGMESWPWHERFIKAGAECPMQQT